MIIPLNLLPENLQIFAYLYQQLIQSFMSGVSISRNEQKHGQKQFIDLKILHGFSKFYVNVEVAVNHGSC